MIWRPELRNTSRVRTIVSPQLGLQGCDCNLHLWPGFFAPDCAYLILLSRKAPHQMLILLLSDCAFSDLFLDWQVLGFFL